MPVADVGVSPVLAGLGAGLLVATAWAMRSGAAAAIRAVLLADAMLAMVTIGAISIWPAPVVITDSPLQP